MPNWTKEQLDAITDRGHSLIVCAAAIGQNGCAGGAHRAAGERGLSD